MTNIKLIKIEVGKHTIFYYPDNIIIIHAYSKSKYAKSRYIHDNFFGMRLWKY